MKRTRLSTWILAGLVTGLIVGAIVHSATGSTELNKQIAGYLSMLTDVFLRLIKMIIAPLVFTGVVAGMGHTDSPGEVGRIGGRAILWFVAASILSLVLGLLLSNALGLGIGVELPHSATGSGVSTEAFNLRNFVSHLVPQSIFLAMSQNDIIAILVFAVFFGFAISTLREREPALAGLSSTIEGAFKVMLKVTDYVMRFAPLGVFAAVASVVTLQGLGVLSVYGKFIGSVYGGMIILCLILTGIGFLFIGPDVFRLLGLVKEPMLIAFSTSSSEATFPKMLEQLEKFGISNKIAAFILPLAYSFNADGSMMYQAFATVFLLQAYGIHVSFVGQIGMLFVMLISSKGIAGVPRASIVVVAATLPLFGVPAEGIVLLLAADTFVDMGRTVTNVVGNSIASAVIARWELRRANDAVQASTNPAQIHR
ncbi:Na+/H+-dicarboxylate symporter [Paraburkholderia sp. BL6665CI2N2]|uniref:dicarboxylate/amino acid:cation symporter n=1 Tax=Paraburkholderia sp. BL6665CI2N2 TaxID=1938806 RepID=UPI00106491BB|nr:dicarboxylate/amino acid:cation symporter [Paraburkholderia sp. BL6665CI2N2]TDY15722.1 Na+/H+-dicarboxylate symporter [Paraburkholderia sp. BL6665CI2N2]